MKFVFDITEISTKHNLEVDADSEEEAVGMIGEMCRQDVIIYDEKTFQIVQVNED